MSTLHAIKDKLIEVILEQHSSTRNSNTPSLESLKMGLLNKELARLIEESTQYDKTDLPLLNALLPVIVRLNSFTHDNAFLGEDQQAHIRETLVELFTLLSTLCVTSQTSLYKSKSGIAYHGFLNSNGTYSNMGEAISKTLKELWDIEQTNAEIDANEYTDKIIPSKVDLLVQSYQNEVEPNHLRSENARLQNESSKKDDLIAELRHQIAALQTKLAAPATEKREPNPARNRMFSPLFMQQHYPPLFNIPAVVKDDKETQTPPTEALREESSCSRPVYGKL